MNEAAQRHLDKAVEYLTKGNEFYRHAGSEIELALEEGATWDECAAALGHSMRWCQKVVAWAKTPEGTSAPSPFSEKDTRDSPDVRGAKRILSGADPELLREVVQSLPEESRDELLLLLTPHKSQREEHERKAIESHAIHGWRPVIDSLGEANLGLVHTLDALVKLAMNRGIDADEDPMGLARERAEMVGRSIHEIEMAWGETPITDKIEELRGERV